LKKGQSMTQKNLGKIVLFFLFQLSLYANAIFTQSVSKNNIYLNETIKVTLQLTVDNNDSIDETYFEEYDTYQFWVTQLKKKTETRDKTHTTYTYEYLLEPKKAGIFTLDEQMIKISSDKIRKFKRWLKVYSQPITIKVLPLYDNLPIQGEYTMALKSDKTDIKANEAIHLTLSIKGKGNLKDIQKFDLGLKDQVVYSDEPIVDAKFKDTNFQGKATQKFLIIANQSFTIPSLELKYYNPLKKEIQIIQTKPLFIRVENKTKDFGDPKSYKYLFLILGVILGIVLFKLFLLLRKRLKRSQLPFYQEIKKAKDDQALYKLLIKNNRNNQFNEFIRQLEGNIYKNKKLKIDKKKILQIFEKFSKN